MIGTYFRRRIRELTDENHFYLNRAGGYLLFRQKDMKTDQQIQKAVMVSLNQEPLLNKGAIGVAVHQGVVTLSGNVPNFLKKVAAERAAWRVPDVKAVAQEVVVVLPEDDRLTDAVIAEQVVNALAGTSVAEFDIQVKVAEREVILGGSVAYTYQKDAAFEAIKLLRGIRHIHNRIKVKPQVDMETVKFRITQALLNRADEEASGIIVECSGNKVILRGKVDSRDEKNIAVMAAMTACGTAEVDDQLVIDAR